MEFVAKSRNVRIAPRKVRLVAKALRRLSVNEALGVLTNASKRAAMPLEKTLKAAIANAKNKAKVDAGVLVVKSVDVFEGSSLKRFRPSTRGRVHPYKKRGSHITIVLADNNSQISNAKSQMPNVKQE